ncbi:L-threonine O-3-phosphate decarboxylase [Xenococcus sp. PCC 7305]|uniref:threonine-phosphate decarboxylase CobD n=1 Tax=Xenococcus sp. PCC 7305 TaxID=102125 RepID=UPI0002AC5A0C|nr:threonine-phosphate decarboxylase CobD [Xenococcus sp. PCC 7305]ELS00705.1 L-threonine O-3-phosphate decarboxylase [Xenococcus sp. PCC 7305]
MARPKHGGNLAWAATIAGCPTSSIKDFSASINPWGIPQSVLKAIQEQIPGLTAYPNPEYPELKSALAEHHGLSTDYILPGNGSAELLTWAARELAQQERTYLVTPAFGDYSRSLRAFKAEIVSLQSPLLPFGDLASLIPRYKLPNSGLLLNNPHNPTGQLWPKAEIMPCLERFALVVIDEAFMDFLPSSQQQSLIDLVPKFSNLVILRSLTKFYSLPGLRIGYAIAHPHLIEKWQAYRDPWSVNSLAAAAAIAALKDQDFQQHTWDWLVPARAQLIKGLSEIPQLQVLPSAVNFLLVKSGLSVTELQQQLLQKHQILIRDCLSFPELGDHYFRVAIRTIPENDYLVKSLKSVFNKVS